MRSLKLDHRNRTEILRYVLLIGLQRRARVISLNWDQDSVRLCLHGVDGIQQLIPPPIHLAEQLAQKVRQLGPWRERIVDWWDSQRRCKVLSERDGIAKLLLGDSSAELRYRVLPFSGGGLVELALLPESGAADIATAILQQAFDSLADGPLREIHVA